MARKKICELIESNTKPAVFRRANGKTYCLLSPAGYMYSPATGKSSPIWPKQQVEVTVERAKDGSLEAFVIAEAEDIDPQEEVEVLWEDSPKRAEPNYQERDEIPF
ncbi:MAG TPA: hypothetical protein VJH91_03755 [Candidatus Paceibacterota bacterium]